MCVCVCVCVRVCNMYVVCVRVCVCMHDMRALTHANGCQVNATCGDALLSAGASAPTPARTAGAHTGLSSASALASDTDTCAARHALWKLLRVLLLQVSEQSTPETGRVGGGGVMGLAAEARTAGVPDGWMGGANRSLWDTLLLGINQLAKVVERDSPAASLDCGRASVSGTRCVEAVSASSSPEQASNLLLRDSGLSWTSNCDSATHWVQLTARPDMAISRVGAVVHVDDGPLLPRQMRVYAGENEGSLRLVREVDIEPRQLCARGPHEVRVLSGATSTFNVVRLSLSTSTSSGGGGGNVRLRGLTVRGLVLGDPSNLGRGEADDTNICKRVEVSTNKAAKKFLTDGRPDTHWQSDGRSGQHWIRLHVDAEAIITGLAIQINANDGNYCPSLVDVFVGDVSSDLKKLRTVPLTPTGLQRCVLFDKMSLAHRIVQVNIRENNGGCDCKVRGIFLSGHFSPTKRQSADPSNIGHVLQDLLSTALAASNGCALQIQPSRAHMWVNTLTWLIQIPEFGEVTRIRATSLLIGLCLTHAAQPAHDAAGNGSGEAGVARGGGKGLSLTINVPNSPSQSGGGGGSRNGGRAGGVLTTSAMRHVVTALLDTLAHTTDMCAALEPLSPTHLSPLPDLHAALTKACLQLMLNATWRPTLGEELRRSLHRVVNVYAPPPSLPLSLPVSLTALLATRPEAVLTKFDYMEVWWKTANAGGDGDEGREGGGPGKGAPGRGEGCEDTWWDARQEKAYRPTQWCPPKVVLYAATVPGPLRMLLNVDTAQGDAPHSTTSYHIEYFEALVSKTRAEGEMALAGEGAGSDEEDRPMVSSVSVTLRPLSTPGRPQTKVGPQTIKELVFDFVRRARGGKGGKGSSGGERAAAYEGGSIVAQSLEHLLLLMKGEPLPDDGALPPYGEARDATGSINIPTDVPLFVRLGVLQSQDSAQVPKARTYMAYV